MATITVDSKIFSPMRCDTRSIPALSQKGDNFFTRVKMPWWRTDISGACYGDGFLSIDTFGTISGEARLNNVPLFHTEVHLHYRPSGILIEKTFTAIDGTYSFTGLDRSSNQHVVTAFIPGENAMVYDHITPV